MNRGFCTPLTVLLRKGVYLLCPLPSYCGCSVYTIVIRGLEFTLFPTLWASCSHMCPSWKAIIGLWVNQYGAVFPHGSCMKSWLWFHTSYWRLALPHTCILFDTDTLWGESARVLRVLLKNGKQKCSQWYRVKMVINPFRIYFGTCSMGKKMNHKEWTSCTEANTGMKVL